MDDRLAYLEVAGAYIAAVGFCTLLFVVWDVFGNAKFLREYRKGRR